MLRTIIIFFIGMFAMMSCTQEPRPIVYGSEDCHFCMMKIMDQRFGAESITDKGKVYKFDSAECLLRYIGEDTKKTQYQHLLVTYIDEPGLLQDATQSFYVVSENIPSPMGGNLSAYEVINFAEIATQKKGGDIYSWQEILDVYSNN